jgi:hypothetical protein
MGDGMTGLTVIFHKSDLPLLQPMFDIPMAARTIHFALGHMRIVKQGRITVFGQPFRLIMADVTTLFGSMAVSLDDIEVTFFAGDMAGAYKILMIEGESRKLDILFGDFMAG